MKNKINCILSINQKDEKSVHIVTNKKMEASWDDKLSYNIRGPNIQFKKGKISLSMGFLSSFIDHENIAFYSFPDIPLNNKINNLKLKQIRQVRK